MDSSSVELIVLICFGILEGVAGAGWCEVICSKGSFELGFITDSFRLGEGDLESR